MSSTHACACPCLVALMACSAAAGVRDPALEQALVCGKSLRTVAVTAEAAALRVDGRVVATLGAGRMFGVVGREDGRVQVRACVGGDIRLGWLDETEVRPLADGDVDLGVEALRIAGALNPQVAVPAYRARLDALAARLAAAAGEEGSARERVRRIGRRLFGAEGFSYRKGVKRLDQVLDRKEGDCVGLSLLYLAAARRLKLPVHLVTWPSHVLVRYENGPERFNVETTANGAIRSVDDPIQHRRGRVAGGIHCMALPNPRALGVLTHVWGAMLSARGQHAEACERFARAVEINPRDAEAHALWGAALHKLGRYGGACRRYARVVVIDPGHEEVHIRWGFALCCLGRYAEAREKFGRGVKLAPRIADGWHGLGVALTRVGQPAAACDHFAKAVALRPDFAAAHLDWAAALLRLGRPAEAQPHLARALALDPALEPQADALRKALLPPP